MYGTVKSVDENARTCDVQIGGIVYEGVLLYSVEKENLRGRVLIPKRESAVIVARIGEVLREIKAHGVAVLLVEQNVRFAATVADRHYLLAQGRVVERLGNDEFQAREGELLTYLGM